MTRKPPDIDFVLRRPFIKYSGDKILQTIEDHILTKDADIEIATLALDELKWRKKAKRITQAQKLFRHDLEVWSQKTLKLDIQQLQKMSV